MGGLESRTPSRGGGSVLGPGWAFSVQPPSIDAVGTQERRPLFRGLSPWTQH